jgi:ABC-2 type transporter
MLRVITSQELSDLDELYLKSVEFQGLKSELEQVTIDPQPQMKITYDSEFATTKGRRRDLVNGRLALIYWRSPAYNLSRILVSLVIAFLLSSVFLNEYLKDVLTEVDMRSRLSVIFLSFIIMGIMAILAVIPVMEKIRDCFYRHRDAGMYDSASLGLALGVVEKYFILFSTTLFCVVVLSTSNIYQGYHGLIGFWVSVCSCLFKLCCFVVSLYSCFCRRRVSLLSILLYTRM